MIKLQKIKMKKEPLYKQIADRIRKYVVNNDLPSGSLLPSQNVLIKHFDVSQITVRQALQQLINEGIVTSVQGKGTFVGEVKRSGKSGIDLSQVDKTDMDLTLTEENIGQQLRFEKLISNLSAEFINLPSDQIDGKINEALKRIVETFNVDRTLLHEFSENRKLLYVTHFFIKPGIQPPSSTITSEAQPWFAKTILNGEIIKVDRIEDLPEAAKLEKTFLLKQGVKSGIVFPLIVGEKVVGALTFTTVFYERSWLDETIQRLQLISEVFSNAIDRKHREQKLRDAFGKIEKQLQLEKLISELSTEFVNLNPNEIDQKIDDGLKLISESLGVDRIALLQFSSDKRELHLTHGHSSNAVHSPPRFLVSEQLPWFSGSLRRGKTLIIPTVKEIPEDAVQERQYVKEQGIKSFLTIPMIVSGSIIGAISYSYMNSEQAWTDDLIQWFRLVTEVFVNALDRKQKAQKIQKAFVEINELKDKLEKENLYLRREIELNYKHEEIVGRSKGIKHVLSQVEKVAEQNTCVLITGETGTGKELIAHAIHNLSPRRGHVMIKVNCAALPASLIESEMFGREKGAYTGALTRRIGRFEAAHGSTIFLDEISDLPLEIQVKLLRVLQEGKFERLGSTKTMESDVRVITATNQNLSEAVKKGIFRNDLYYRLNVFPIVVPPLRERRDDIPLLIWYFVKEFENAMGKKIESIPQHSLKLLLTYSWPGNIRELKNVIERAMILCEGPVLKVNRIESEETITQNITLEDATRNHIRKVLESAEWRVSGKNGAAELLGLKRTTLLTKMKKLNIKRPIG
jgi:formate hydrogenlyase transcriptional activator